MKKMYSINIFGLVFCWLCLG